MFYLLLVIWITDLDRLCSSSWRSLQMTSQRSISVQISVQECRVNPLLSEVIVLNFIFVFNLNEDNEFSVSLASFSVCLTHDDEGHRNSMTFLSKLCVAVYLNKARKRFQSQLSVEVTTQSHLLKKRRLTAEVSFEHGSQRDSSWSWRRQDWNGWDMRMTLRKTLGIKLLFSCNLWSLTYNFKVKLLKSNS